MDDIPLVGSLAVPPLRALPLLLPATVPVVVIPEKAG